MPRSWFRRRTQLPDAPVVAAVAPDVRRKQLATACQASFKIFNGLRNQALAYEGRRIPDELHERLATAREHYLVARETLEEFIRRQGQRI